MNWKEKFLNKEEQKKIESLIGEFETQTQTELTVCIARSSDPYPAAPMRFALYFSTLACVTLSFFIELPESAMWPILVFLLFIPFNFIGGFKSIKRWFLTEIEMNRETEEKALEIFFRHSTSKTQHQSNILLYLSLLEHKLIFLVDEEIKKQIPQQEINDLTIHLQGHLKEKRNAAGLEYVMGQLRKKVASAPDTNIIHQLENKILWLDNS